MVNTKVFRSLTAVVVLITAIAVTGCGTRNEKIKDAQIKEEASPSAVLDRGTISENSTEEYVFDPEHEFDDLTEEMLDVVPEVEDLTQDELFEMSVDEFRAFISVRSPDYRTVYGVGDKEMTDEDWESLRCLISYRLFGELWPATYVETEIQDGEEESVSENSLSYEENLYEEEVTDEEIDEIREYLETLSDDDFISIIEGVYQENYGEPLGLADFTEEEFLQFRNEIMAGLQEEKENN